VLVSPTSPTVAFGLGDKTADPIAMYLNDVATVPGVARRGSRRCRCRRSRRGTGRGGRRLPVGLQIMAPLLRDD
jgi:aspartyl-tRNA(Asn)/glutamyl-tRNA(Gln) amidotransferase subunit A